MKKILKKLLLNVRNARNVEGTFSEKLDTFLTLTRLQIKSTFFRTTNQKVGEHFSNYKFSGYDYPTIEYLFNQIFVSNEYYFKASTDEPIIIDCGANIGMSVLYFKKLYPKSKIIAFEPNPYAFRLLEMNIKDNNIQNVELHNIALFDKESEVSFYIGDNIGTLVGSIMRTRGGDHQLKIKAQKLSDYLNGLETVDLIKLDVEGVEINVVSDLFDNSYINKAKEYIVEYHHNIKENNSLLSSFLKKFELSGFSYNIKAYFTTINSFQDIFIRFYKKSNPA